MAARELTSRLRGKVWHGSIPLEIRLAKEDCRTYDDSDAYLIQFPRLSYLALLTTPLHTFFSRFLIYPCTPSSLWLSHESVPLKWHYPLGLLYDLYAAAEPFHPCSSASSSPSPPPRPLSPSAPHDDDAPPTTTTTRRTLPFRLTLHTTSYPTAHLIPLDDDPTRTMRDLFMHAVKEADYLRTGTGKTVMFLSQADSEQLWHAVVTHDFARFHAVNQKLLHPQGLRLRHLPVRLYLPYKPRGGHPHDDEATVRVVQSLVSASLGSSE
ncbi:Autophagy protein 5 [Pleosporales sp. CAS-2024a]